MGILLKYQEGGLFTYSERPDALYKKNGSKWEISLDKGKSFKSIEDPDGKRSAILNKNAKPYTKTVLKIKQDDFKTTAADNTFVNNNKKWKTEKLDNDIKSSKERNDILINQYISTLRASGADEDYIFSQLKDRSTLLKNAEAAFIHTSQNQMRATPKKKPQSFASKLTDIALHPDDAIYYAMNSSEEMPDNYHQASKLGIDWLENSRGGNSLLRALNTFNPLVAANNVKEGIQEGDFNKIGSGLLEFIPSAKLLSKTKKLLNTGKIVSSKFDNLNLDKVSKNNFLSTKHIEDGYAINRDKNSNRFFLTKNNEVVGDVELFNNFITDSKGGKWGDINISIKPAHRGNGLSKPLYDTILQEAKYKGLNGIHSVDELLNSPEQSMAIRKYYSGKYSDDKNILENVNKTIKENNEFIKNSGDTDFTPLAKKVYLIDASLPLNKDFPISSEQFYEIITKPYELREEVRKQANEYFKLVTSEKNYERARALDKAEGTNYVAALDDLKNQHSIFNQSIQYELPFNIKLGEVREGAAGHSDLSQAGKIKYALGNKTSIKDREVIISKETPIDDAKRVVRHELKHHYTVGRNSDVYNKKYSEKLSNILNSPTEINKTNPEFANKLIQPAFKGDKRSLFEYLESPQEIDAYINTNMRDELVDKGVLKDHWDQLDVEKVIEFVTKNPSRSSREYLSMVDPKKFIEIFNKGIYATSPLLINEIINKDQKRNGGLIYKKGGRIDGRSSTPDFVKPYLTSSSKFENGKFFELAKPSSLMDGFSMGADANGFFIYTHRARSKSRMDLDFTKKEQNFIESTG